MSGQRRIRRFEILDAQDVNLDGFAAVDPELGLIAFDSPYDPAPSIVIEDGVVVELDGRRIEEFDIVDSFIARYGIDLAIADEAMARSDLDYARDLVDMTVPRERITRLIAGTTPAKLARIVALLNPVELQMAIAKMHVRRTPSNQAHVTNQQDDPLLLAADAAAAVAFGFRELETTVPVLGNAPSNAIALLIGSQVGVPGALTQCSIEEGLELRLGMRGLTTYAETVSIYGTEQVFIDGDDTPWSKGWLASAYASRGLKMRLTSGAGAEVLMGAAERCSMAYLESRCVSLARAIGTQGVQNGGIDGAAVVASVPEGVRELACENLMVMMRGLESCSGNDTLVSESDIRRTSRTLPILLAGSDYIFSGFGSIPGYDNTFALSNFNAEDLDDYLVLQRDWGVDGALRPQQEDHIEDVRRYAARAAQAVYRDLGLADFSDEHLEQVIYAHGSRDLTLVVPGKVPAAAKEIEARQVTVIDVIASLARTGFTDIAENLVATMQARGSGDHLQPAAIFDEDLRVLSAVTDPNDYAGPGTGYRMSRERHAAINDIRQARTSASLAASQQQYSTCLELIDLGPAQVGEDPREICLGISPAFAQGVWCTLSGQTVADVLDEITAGVEDEGGFVRLIRVPGTIDLGLIGLTAARLAGSGIGLGLQGKGTALIHQRDLAPLANLELFSVAPLITPQMYRELGRNAVRHSRGQEPPPILLGGTEEAITARYHTRAVALVAVERDMCKPNAGPRDVMVAR